MSRHETDEHEIGGQLNPPREEKDIGVYIVDSLKPSLPCVKQGHVSNEAHKKQPQKCWYRRI